MAFNIETTKIGHKEALKPCWLPCPIERGMRILGGKWKGSILWHLKDDPVRFNELARLLEGCSKKMIYQRLVEMEGIGLVKRNVLSTRPIAVAYCQLSNQNVPPNYHSKCTSLRCFLLLYF